MATHDSIVHLEPGDVIAVRDRLTAPGCALELATGNITYLSPEQEQQLFLMLMERRFGIGRDLVNYRFGGMDAAQFNVVGLMDSKTGKARLRVVDPTGPGRTG